VLRAALLLLMLAVAIVVGPYAVSRLLSPMRALEIQTIQFGSGPVGDDQQPKETLRIACYNIAHGRGLADSNWDGGTEQQRTQRLDDIADLLREMDADVVVLNEVDFDSSWSHSVDQAAYLAERAGYRYCATLRNLDFRVGLRTWRFGNAVLSRFPIMDAGEIDMPGYARWETVLAGKKRALFCEVDVEGERFGVVATHLSHRSEELRVASAQRLLDFADAYAHPLFIAGDFNSTPTGFPDARPASGGHNAVDTFDRSGRFQRLPETFEGDESMLTFRSDEPARIIDWVLVPQGLGVERYDVIASDLSDHRPIVADIAIDE
jgi:endonuclease/exonuclease/phosphatase family metal-dependent hydrolase